MRQRNLAYGNRLRGSAAWSVRNTPHLLTVYPSGVFDRAVPLSASLKTYTVAPAEKTANIKKRVDRTNDHSRMRSSDKKVCKPQPCCISVVLDYHNPRSRRRATEAKDLWPNEEQTLPVLETTRSPWLSAQALPRPTWTILWCQVFQITTSLERTCSQAEGMHLSSLLTSGQTGNLWDKL